MGGRFASEDEIRKAERLAREEFEPQVFDSLAAVQAHVANEIRNYRCVEAENLRNLAVQYELRALSEADITERERLAAFAEGVRTAAARVDVDLGVVA